jgi:hypothetical protein
LRRLHVGGYRAMDHARPAAVVERVADGGEGLVVTDLAQNFGEQAAPRLQGVPVRDVLQVDPAPVLLSGSTLAADAPALHATRALPK